MKQLIFGTLTLILIAILAVGAAGAWGWNELNSPLQHSATQEVEIPTGSAPDTVIQILAEHGVIKQTLPLRIYVKLTGAGRLFKAGSYKFATPITPLQVIKRLEEGGEALAKVTIIEGWNRWDIANALARTSKLNLTDSKHALVLLNNPREIRDLAPSAGNLEGYLFPDTYFIDARTTAPTLVSQMVSRFRKVWQSRLQDRAKQLNLTPQQVVTIASLIETEAKLPDERPIVASVIYNRLRKGIPLALDCTIVYASKAAGAWRNDGKVYQSDIDRKSPYNTRQVKGLPPGPIGSPGLPSLEAALNPARTDFIYYVRNPARDDGAHNFYSDAAGFEQGVLALRAWERQRDQRQASALQHNQQNRTNPGTQTPTVRSLPHQPIKPAAKPHTPATTRSTKPQANSSAKRTRKPNSSAVRKSSPTRVTQRKSAAKKSAPGTTKSRKRR